MKNKHQRLRHKIIKKHKDSIDCVCGHAYKSIEYKLEALAEYRYSIVVENSEKDYYFSEKLIDCFLTGTIPIFKSCRSIGKFFNTKGMVIFRKLKDLDFTQYNKTFYENRLPYIKENFEKAKQYRYIEDMVYTCLKNHLPV